ncbi:MAG: 2,3-bisphosphoglycerate-independent phosphoglycerate mutase [Bacilli bacterium]
MKKIVTIIFDGFGMRDEEKGNAIKAANMVNFNKFWKEYPHALLEASEEKVGLTKGQFGNSEVGHMTIGAGRLVKQNETIVNELLANIENNEVYRELIKDNDKRIHLMGLCSDGNVHAGIDDFINMYNSLVKRGFTKIYFHLITDGRDTNPMSAYKYIKMIEDEIRKNNIGTIATICGRYYAMDRDDNYKRTSLYYDLVARAKGTDIKNIEKALNSCYKIKETDEFIRPLLANEEGKIKNGDILIWMNYRADRSKQILSAFTDPDYTNFSTLKMDDLKVYSFFPIDKNINTISFLEKPVVKNPLGLYLSELDFTQARIAESEKFPHVTYFFDGGYKGKINKCNTFEIPSPNVKTYDLMPEMSAIPVTKKVIECMMQDYDFILVNFANPDMVGHTGNFLAASKACMAVDLCLSKIVEKAEENFYKVILLADHGNADIMIDENDQPVTTHTLSKIPFILMDDNVKLKDEGDLTMVAPTILEYMEIALPEEMKETESLIMRG